MPGLKHRPKKVTIYEWNADHSAARTDIGWQPNHTLFDINMRPHLDHLSAQYNTVMAQFLQLRSEK